MLGQLFGDDGGEAATKRNLSAARAAFEGIKLPELTWKDYAPELYQSESANYELSKEDPVVRSAQMSVLSKLAGLADQGLSDEDAAAFAKARSQGNQMSRAGTEAAIANAQARGVGGSGMEFAMREIANQQGAQRSQEAGLDQAAAAARQRAMYNQAYGQQLGQVRGQDAQANQANTDIINRFNSANTQQRNQMNLANTDMRNQAQQMNNQGRNNVQQQSFDNQLKRAAGISGGYRDQANADAAAGAARASERNQLIGIGAGAFGSYLGRK
jgi:hypothetical protein